MLRVRRVLLLVELRVQFPHLFAQAPIGNQLPTYRLMAIDVPHSHFHRDSKLDYPMETEINETIKNKDIINLVTRCRVTKDEFNPSAQVVLYGDKIAFTSFTDCMITTIIEDKSISQTMKIIFDELWKKYRK